MREYGFYHPEHGYWQAMVEPDEDTLATYPEGTVEVPVMPGADYEWDGDEWVHNPQEVKVNVPQTVSRFQAKAAMLEAGILEQVEAAVAASDSPLTKLAWAEAVEFNRASDTIINLGASLGLTDDQIDELFVSAAKIVA